VVEVCEIVFFFKYIWRFPYIFVNLHPYYETDNLAWAKLPVICTINKRMKIEMP